MYAWQILGAGYNELFKTPEELIRFYEDGLTRNEKLKVRIINRKDKQTIKPRGQITIKKQGGELDKNKENMIQTIIPYTDSYTGTKGEIDLSKSRAEFGLQMAKNYAKQNGKRVTEKTIDFFEHDAGAYHKVRDLIEDIETTDFNEIIKAFKQYYPIASTGYNGWQSALKTGLVITSEHKEGNYSNHPYIYNDDLAVRIREAGINRVQPIIDEIISVDMKAEGGKIKIRLKEETLGSEIKKAISNRTKKAIAKDEMDRAKKYLKYATEVAKENPDFISVEAKAKKDYESAKNKYEMMAEGGEISYGTKPTKINKSEAKKLFEEGKVVYIKTEPKYLPDTSANSFILFKDSKGGGGMNIYLAGGTQGEYGFDNIINWLKERTDYPDYEFEFYTLYSDRGWFLENGQTLAEGGEITDRAKSIVQKIWGSKINLNENERTWLEELVSIYISSGKFKSFTVNKTELRALNRLIIKKIIYNCGFNTPAICLTDMEQQEVEYAVHTEKMDGGGTIRKYGLYSIYKGEENGLFISEDIGKLKKLKERYEEEKRSGERFVISPVKNKMAQGGQMNTNFKYPAQLNEIIAEGKKKTRYIFLDTPEGERLINNKYGNEWWERATKHDIERVWIAKQGGSVPSSFQSYYINCGALFGGCYF